MEIIKNREKYNPKNKPEIIYDAGALTKLKYVKIILTGSDNVLYEIRTDVKFLGNLLISLYSKPEWLFDITCPQDVMLKFVTNDAMYIAKAVLHEIKEANNMVYFSIIPPKKMIKQQSRKYDRVDIIRNSVLVISDESGKSSTYMSKTVNLSASGVLINNLESIFSDEVVAIQLSKNDCYHILLFLEHDIALKLSAKFVRYENENENGSYRYAFQFLKMKPDDTEFLFKYTMREQLTQLKSL